MRAVARHVIRAAVVVSAGVAVVAAQSSTASAATTNTWGSFSVAGASKAYTGTMSLGDGFPATTFTSTSSQATVVSGASTWQAPSTPPGAVYGTSQGKQYLNQRPNANDATHPAVTTYTFATPTPASGWSFVLGDIDADQATITATAPDGSAVPVSGFGFQSVYNYCHRAVGPSCDSANLNDLPSWNDTTGVLLGNATKSDTEGASGWFSPNVPLKTLTITYQQRSGLPVYQTWFATKTSAASGTVSVDGQVYGGAKVTVTDASGTVVATTTTNDEGAYSVPQLVNAAGYHVSVETPPGAADAAPLEFDTTAGDATGLDFDFDIATVTVTSTVTDAEGEPVANEPLVITRDGDEEPAVSTTTDDDGGFTAELLPSENYTAIVDGATDQPIHFVSLATDGAIPALVQPAAPGDPTPPPTSPAPPVTPPATATSPAVPVVSGTEPELAFTGSRPAWPFAAGIVVLLAGVGLVVGSRRAKRDRQ